MLVFSALVVSGIVVPGDASEAARTDCCAISRTEDDATIAATNEANRHFFSRDI
jgi:hypothetical protein